MNLEFNWNDCLLNDKQKDEIESKIKQDSEIDPDNNFAPCHQGSLEINCVISGPLFTDLSGNIKCSCGKTLLTFIGMNDGSTIHYRKNE